MIKSIMVLTLLVACLSAVRAQKAGEVQVSLLLGNGMMFDQDLSYVTPKYDNSAIIGTGVGNSGDPYQSDDPGLYLNFNDLGENSLVNRAGVQGRCFLSDNLDVNLMFCMDLRSTPKKDYIEGDASVADMVIQSSKYVEGRLTNNWMANVGSNMYFQTSNSRISLYAGVQAGFQMGRVKTQTPYTGKVYNASDGTTVDYNVYVSCKKAGQVMCMTGALLGGVEYSLAQGLILGLEVAPFAYQYSLLEVYPTGEETYRADHHAFRFFASPNMKIGFRF